VLVDVLVLVLVDVLGAVAVAGGALDAQPTAVNKIPNSDSSGSQSRRIPGC
jgi:hypothetical protein